MPNETQTRRKHQKTPSRDIDLALDVTRACMKPGDSIGQRELAEICGCSNTAIYLIEKRAIRKLRDAIRKKFGMNFAQLLATKTAEF